MDRGENGSNWPTNTMSNRPLIVGALFLGTYFVPFLVLIGLPLTYIFRRDAEEDWEVSHYRYLARTFWQGLAFALIVGFIGIALFAAIGDGQATSSDAGRFAAFALLGIGWALVLAYCGVRVILSLVRSAAHKPIPAPATWWI